MGTKIRLKTLTLKVSQLLKYFIHVSHISFITDLRVQIDICTVASIILENYRCTVFLEVIHSIYKIYIIYIH